jgi:predicted transcriptional regulator of viral defense system
MAPISRFPKATEPVREFFSKSTQKVFTLEDLEFIFQEYMANWSLRVSTVEDFAKQLVQSNILKANKFEFEERIKSQTRFWSTKADTYDVAVSLIPRTHLSHRTALFLHNIIKTPPKSIYITSEQSQKVSKKTYSDLEQDNIDRAFSKQQRQTNAKCKYSGKEIIALNGMFTNRLGVISISGKPVTSLERTLIDITVRPTYGGGVSEVLKSFFNAKDNVDVDVLVSILDDINYTYPYYQSIGFYFEKAGYDSLQILKLKKRKKFVDFYLDYAMTNPTYSKDWRLFYPKQLEKEI